MIRGLCFMLAMVAAVPTQHALAASPGPVCREPTVLDQMSLQLRQRAYYVRVEPDLVWEEPTTARNVIRCGVCVAVALYDTPRYGDQPVAACEAHAFDVQTLLNGFVVRYLR
jgi:hypothetical protein